MIVRQYIRDFEDLGFGMFVHFGLYSIIGKGEWAKHQCRIPDAEYEPLRDVFCPRFGWAEELARTAKAAGCRYITLTARHHDGFSLYDTRGLTDYDVAHGPVPGRDLIREFCDACRQNGLIPFFYHTLLDWHHPEYHRDFPAYLRYLRASVELLCTNYGKIGGIWFDGMWDGSHKGDDWEEDAMYSMIRSHQPEAMIINNTGLGARGELGHIELDSVTFERGKPKPINLADSPKYVASEMCQIFGDHWGYAADDLDFKSPASVIEDLVSCRKYGSNFLLNVGPTGDGSLRLADIGALSVIGRWTEIHRETVGTPRPWAASVPGFDKDFILKEPDKEVYYLFVHDLPIVGDPNTVIARAAEWARAFPFPAAPASVRWIDSGEELKTAYDDDAGTLTVTATPYPYGKNLVVRVARIEL